MSDDHAPLRVVVVDDHELFRSGLSRVLDDQDGLTVVGQACDGDEAVQIGAQLRPDVVVMDVRMPGMSGSEATRRLLERSPRSSVLMLSASGDDGAVLDAILAGASGYLLKSAALPEIVSGIRAAAAGESVISPAVASSLLARLRRNPPPPLVPAAVPELSARELDVLQLIVAGCENGDIAVRLHLSQSTIKHRVSSILDKLGVKNRIQAAVVAVRLALVDDLGDLSV